MSSDDRAGGRDDPGHERLILLPAAGTFDGRDHVIPVAVFSAASRSTVQG